MVTSVAPLNNLCSATDRYTETLNSALNYFSSLAQSNSGWKRLSSASVRPPRGASGSGGSPSSGMGTGSTASSPTSHRQNNDDLMANLPGGSTPSSAASAAIESLLPSITVAKKSVPGKSAEIVRATIILPGLDEQTDLEDWRAVLEWDRMVDSSTVMQTLDDNTCITKTIFKNTWPASPRDALLIETTLLDHNAVLHIATSIKPSHDDPIFLRPSPPYVRAYLPLVAWHIQLVPADLEDTVSFTSFNSLTASQNKPVMPRHSIRVSFYYQIDMRGWAVNSSVSMQSHVPSCIANVYRLLRRQGVPPHVSRHSARIQLDLNEYDPATGIYELRYDVIPPDSDDLLLERKTVSSKLRQFRLGFPPQEDDQESQNDPQDPSNIPQELVLSDDDEADDVENESTNEASHVGYVDVELDGEKWGLGSDIVVHIFMNDIEDEEFVQEHVECLKYMGRDRYILRMKHTDIESNHGAINVKLRVERIPQQMSGGANLLTYQQLRIQRQQQEEQVKEEDRATLPDLNGLVVSVNGHEKDILPFHRSSIQGSKRTGMSLQEQLELSQQIVQEVDRSSETNGIDRQENRTTASPLLLMSSSMPTTMQTLARSSQSILSNGTSTMAPGNTNPTKVNSSYAYFNSLLLEPTTSWKAVTKQRGVQVSKLEVQGHAPGIVKGEGVFEDYTIWDIKAALDCASARKIWDKLFDESHMLQQATPSSILSYVRLKGFWPTSPKDMAVLNTTFITKDAIHYFATSTDDTNQYPSIPPPVSPFVRSELVVSGWYLETVKPRSVRIVYIAQAAPAGWMVPGTALSAMTTEMPLCVAEIIKYLETFGSPPTLVSIRRGRALGVDYSHEKSSFRLEYVQDSNPIFSGHRALQQQQQRQPFDSGGQRRITIDYTAGVGSAGSIDSPQFGSPKLGPTDKLLAEIRLDARVWARNGDCDITIDPPPSKVTCTCVPHDGTGYRLRIEHSSGRAVPAGGKVLLMARKPAKSGCGIVVNGVAIKMPPMDHLVSWISQAPSSSPLSLTNIDGALAQRSNQDEDDETQSTKDTKPTKVSVGSTDSISSTQVTPLNSPEQKRNLAGLDSPLHYAQNAMDLLAKIMADSDDSWSVVSESKGGMRVTKRFMPTDISDQVPLVRGEKVIEGFSQEEIATVIGTLGTRSKPGTPPSSSPGQGRPRAHLHLSAWILERIDPYSTSHPIPSTRVTYMTALDLGGSVPQRISGMIQTMFPKMITQVESYLHAQAAPPIVRIPEQMVHSPQRHLDEAEISNLSIDETLPKILPWIKPSSRMISWEFKMKDSFSHMTMTLDQFQLQPSRLDLAIEKRSRLVRKQSSTRSESKDNSSDGSSNGRTSDKSHDADTTVTKHKDKDKEEDKDETSKNRTVVELVVDLKQYPMGYNIMTSIKVDPEFLLQQKQQRDTQKLISTSTSNVKFTGSTSLSNLPSASNSGATKFIGGFDTGPSELSGSSSRLSLDAAEGASEAASTGTGIAAVLGGSSMIPRALPSSTSLIRILPPPITVQVIDIPPAPSHSSSLSGVSKRRKHLIIISVPEAESSVSHVQAQQQAAAAATAAASTTSSILGVGVIRSTGTAKPVVTTNSALGSTSAMFGFDDKVDSASHASSPVSSSLEIDSGMDTIRVKPPSGADRSILASPSKMTSSVSEPGLKPSLNPPSSSASISTETRMFQFGVKVDRLEHKDLDHSAKDASAQAADSEKEWTGKVMVDGLPVQVLVGWTRQELGFLDGVVDEEEVEDNTRLDKNRSGDHAVDQQNGNGEYKEDEEIFTSSKSPSRRRKHHRQQLAALNEKQQQSMDQEVSSESQPKCDKKTLPDATTTLREIESAEKAVRPSSSMAGLSNFLMNVGLLGSLKGPKDDTHKDGSLHDEDEDQDDDRTIRASKGTSRSGLGSVLSGKSSKTSSRRLTKKDETNGHDLDLESLHGSIVFRDRGEDDQGFGWKTDDGLSQTQDEEHGEHEENGRGSRASTIRRRKGKQIRASDVDQESSDRARSNSRRNGHSPGRRHKDHESDEDSSIDKSRLLSRRGSSRSSRHPQHRSGRGWKLPGSTNGADHPRFRGSHLYAYTFRNLFWSSVLCFVVGLLLRIYVIGPSFLKTVTSGHGLGGGGSTTYYYYYRTAARPRPTGSYSPLTSIEDVDSVVGSRVQTGMVESEGSGDSTTRPQGIRELFTIRKLMGWDIVLLAYPSQEQASYTSSKRQGSRSSKRM
ncbi:hypothetical protein BGZ82_000241 [Podila clonocystis]|nr:hypothetical protein BGZ82_000241 [Podila clonocystis]